MSSSIAIQASAGVGIDRDDTDLARTTMRRVSLRLLPFLFVLYVVNFLDRANVAIAALQMNRDLHFSATAYGFGAGIFSLGYALFEVPSNLVLARVGARYWIARIMITWGLIAAAMIFVRTPLQFYGLRFLLGVAEAGFVPGIFYYLNGWFPAAQVRRLKAEDGPDMIVWGSGTLIQTLLREKLVDRMHVWTHPVTIGTGKRLFAEGTLSATWKLVKSRVGDAGVIIATYEPAGELVTGTIGA